VLGDWNIDRPRKDRLVVRNAARVESRRLRNILEQSIDSDGDFTSPKKEVFTPLSLFARFDHDANFED